MEKFEKLLLENEFKKVWFNDDSGYWFHKKYKFPIFGYVDVQVEPDNNVVYFELKSNDEYLDKKYSVKSWNDVNKLLHKFNLVN